MNAPLDPAPFVRRHIGPDDEQVAAMLDACREVAAQEATHPGDEDDGRRLLVDYSAPSGSARVELRLAGRFNVHNALAVVALGADIEGRPVLLVAASDDVVARGLRADEIVREASGH